MRALAALSRAWTRLTLWRCAEVGRDVVVRGRVWVHGGGRVVLGDRVIIDGRLVPVELHARPSGTLLIGDDVVLEHGASIEVEERVEIGAGCRLGPFAKVMDNHFHPVAGDRHHRPPSKPVLLEPRVHVGERAIVLPGAWLEAGVQLAPGAVVSRRVKARPAKRGPRGGTAP